jgi:hypothetical protein
MTQSPTQSKPVNGVITTRNLNVAGAATPSSAVQVRCDNDTKTVGIQVSGTYTSGNNGSLPGMNVQGSIDNVNWFTIDEFCRVKSGSLPGNTAVSAIFSAQSGLWLVKNDGYAYIRVCPISGTVTGSANITLVNSAADYPAVRYDTYSATNRAGPNVLILMSVRSSPLRRVIIKNWEHSARLQSGAAAVAYELYEYVNATGVTSPQSLIAPLQSLNSQQPPSTSSAAPATALVGATERSSRQCFVGAQAPTGLGQAGLNAESKGVTVEKGGSIAMEPSSVNTFWGIGVNAIIFVAYTNVTWIEI